MVRNNLVEIASGLHDRVAELLLKNEGDKVIDLILTTLQQEYDKGLRDGIVSEHIYNPNKEI